MLPGTVNMSGLLSDIGAVTSVTCMTYFRAPREAFWKDSRKVR